VVQADIHFLPAAAQRGGEFIAQQPAALGESDDSPSKPRTV
jgi:hypothetical protein